MREVIDTLGHDIKGREAAVERAAERKPEHINEHSEAVNNDLFVRMKNLAADFANSRFELNKFLFKAM